MEKNFSETSRYSSKFRAWDRDNSTLHKWSCYDDYPLKGKNGTVPQEYIGFHDKNEHEIYLGDIVQFKGFNTFVRFINGSYILEILEPKSEVKFFSFGSVKDHTNEMEIIGNTHTHSEYIVYHLIEMAEKSR